MAIRRPRREGAIVPRADDARCPWPVAEHRADSDAQAKACAGALVRVQARLRRCPGRRLALAYGSRRAGRELARPPSWHVARDPNAPWRRALRCSARSLEPAGTIRRASSLAARRPMTLPALADVIGDALARARMPTHGRVQIRVHRARLVSTCRRPSLRRAARRRTRRRRRGRRCRRGRSASRRRPAETGAKRLVAMTPVASIRQGRRRARAERAFDGSCSKVRAHARRLAPTPRNTLRGERRRAPLGAVALLELLAASRTSRDRCGRSSRWSGDHALSGDHRAAAAGATSRRQSRPSRRARRRPSRPRRSRRRRRATRARTRGRRRRPGRPASRAPRPPRARAARGRA